MTDADVLDDYYSDSESEFEAEGIAEQSTNDDSDDNDSCSLSPASAARIEALTRELNAIKKVKVRLSSQKKRSRPLLQGSPLPSCQ